MNSIVKNVSRLLAVALAAGGVACADGGKKVNENKVQASEVEIKNNEMQAKGSKIEDKKGQTTNETRECRMKVIKTINVNGKQETTEYELNNSEDCDKAMKEMKEMNLGKFFDTFGNSSGFDTCTYYDLLGNFVFNDPMFDIFGWYNAWFNPFLGNNGKKQNNVDSEDKANESVESKEDKSSDEKKAEDSKDVSTEKPLDISKNSENNEKK